MAAPEASLLPTRKRRTSDGGATKFLYKLFVACVMCFLIGWTIGRMTPLLNFTQNGHMHTAAAALARRTEEMRKSLGLPKLPEIELPKGVYRCDDSCSSAKDGVCDDGRFARDKATAVKCDLGSDCTDCGGFNMVDHNGAKGPIERLFEAKPDLKLFVRTTSTNPSFKMLYTDPTKDLDVSEAINRNGQIESGITELFREVLAKGCIEPNTGARRLVLDVGANFGYYSVYAALLGCRVIAWEPVPLFRAFTQYVLDLNKVAHLVTLRDTVVAETDGTTMEIKVPTVGIWGTAGVVHANIHDPAKESVSALTERIDSVVTGDEQVQLMKMDVEGFEAKVYNSATKLLNKGLIQNIVLEYNQGIAEHSASLTQDFLSLIEDNPKMIQDMLQRQFKIGMMNDGVAKTEPYNGLTLPVLPEVTQSVIWYDLQDAADFRDSSDAHWKGKPAPDAFNCPLIEELSSLNPASWSMCIVMPHHAHPKSLRSSFPFNTNLWATKQYDLIRLKGTPSVLPPTADLTKEYFVSGSLGSGGYSCAHVPPHMLVGIRCPCSWLQKQPAHDNATNRDKCNKESELVLKYLKLGKLKWREPGQQSASSA